MLKAAAPVIHFRPLPKCANLIKSAIIADKMPNTITYGQYVVIIKVAKPTDVSIIEFISVVNVLLASAAKAE